MPLVSETKMVDARKQSVSGTSWPEEPRGQCSKLRPLLQFPPAFLEPMTRIFYKYAHLPTLSLSFAHFHLQGQHTLSSVTSREGTITLSFQLTAVYRHENVYVTQPFSYLLHHFGEIFFSFKNNRNFVKPPKETNNMGEDTFLHN